MSKYYERVTHRKGNLQPNTQMKSYSVSLVIKEMQRKITYISEAKLTLALNSKCWRGDGETEYPLLMGVSIGPTASESLWQYVLNVKVHIRSDQQFLF